MANQEHLDILKQGVEAWNQWRKEHTDVEVDLTRADLSDADLSEANLSGAYLSEANLNGADLSGANLSEAYLIDAYLIDAYLTRANLSKANLSEADLSGTNLNHADLRGADLNYTNLRSANLRSANLSEADLMEATLESASVGGTVFGDVDLSVVKGLETVQHMEPSTIGIDTIIRSQGNIPEIFLRNAGVPDPIIEAIPSLIGSLKPIDFYSCFISYSSKDQDFAQRLYSDLQSKGVRCWFAVEHLKIGDKFRHRIDESIRMYDKLLIVLSEASLASTWVSYEVEKALNKEPEGIPNVLFPIRLDKAILTCETDWAKDILKSRHIGDFEHWKHHDEYQVAFERLLRDLKAQL